MPHPATAQRLRLRPGLWSWQQQDPALSSPGVAVRGVTWTVELAMGPADGPLRASGLCQWYDVTPYVREFSTRRGRTTEFSAYAPGTASLTFDNRTRLFDASYTAGQFYGRLTPMRRVRISATIGVVSAAVFSGLITQWPIAYPGMVDSEVTVHAIDAFRVLEQTELPGSAYGAAVLADAPTYYWPMQSVDEFGTVTDIMGGVDASVAFDAVAGEMSGPIGESYGVSSPTNPSGSLSGVPGVQIGSTIEAWAGPGTYANPPGPSAAGTQVSPGDTFYVLYFETDLVVRYSHGGMRDVDGGTRFVYPTPTTTTSAHTAVTVDGKTIQVYFNGNLIGTSALIAGSYTPIGSYTSAVILSASSKPMSHAAIYPTVLPAERIRSHYLAGFHAYGHPVGERAGERVNRILDAAGWPSADRAISTGSTVVDQWLPDSGSAISGCRECEDTEQGYFYIAADGGAVFRDRQWIWTNPRATTTQATFTDQSGIGYVDIEVDGGNVDFIRNDITVTYTGGSVREKDPNALFLEGESISSNIPATGGWVARQLAKYRLRSHKDPATRIPSLQVIPDTAPATFAPLLNLDLGDRVSVVRTPATGNAITVAAVVQGIDHNVTVDGPWRMGFYLSPSPESYTEGSYLLVGDATYGVVGERTPRVVAY